MFYCTFVPNWWAESPLWAVFPRTHVPNARGREAHSLKMPRSPGRLSRPLIHFLIRFLPDFRVDGQRVVSDEAHQDKCLIGIGRVNAQHAASVQEGVDIVNVLEIALCGPIRFYCLRIYIEHGRICPSSQCFPVRWTCSISLCMSRITSRHRS